MKLSVATAALAAAASVGVVDAQGGEMVKMCLFYDTPSGHARSDPIINQECPSGHVHTFYGPLNFHPDTTYQDLLSTPPSLSTSPFVENQSLYWHPSIYEVADNPDGTQTYTRVSNLETSPYYRWDNSVLPRTEAFPPGFRMIAASDDPGADGGEAEGFKAMFTECCTLLGGEEESCESWERLMFPDRACDFLGLALAMPTCWNGELGDTNNHKDHMAYTLNGELTGECPDGYGQRLPQIQLFLRITGYRGDTYRYQLSDGSTSQFHVDFFNGWQEGKLQEIINGCLPYPDQEVGEYNPPCDCTPGEESVHPNFLTENENVAEPACDNDVRRLIINEITDVTGSLPSGTCQGAPLITKSWEQLTADLFTCEPPPPPPDTTTTQSPTTTTTTTTSQSPTTTTTTTTQSPTTTTTTTQTTTTTTTSTENEPEEESDLRWVVCGRGVREGLKRCGEGGMDERHVDDLHEVRCCKDGEGAGGGWSHKCLDEEEYFDVLARTKVDWYDELCHEENFYDALEICDEAGGRLCTKEEVLNSCTKGTGCGHDNDLIWTCTPEDGECGQSSECCSGVCHGDGYCEPWW